MISLSHWGMFEVAPPPMFVVPEGFEFSEDDLAEWRKPDGIIELVPSKEKVFVDWNWWPLR